MHHHNICYEKHKKLASLTKQKYFLSDYSINRYNNQ